jgi:hypothetical protein
VVTVNGAALLTFINLEIDTTKKSSARLFMAIRAMIKSGHLNTSWSRISPHLGFEELEQSHIGLRKEAILLRTLDKDPANCGAG